MNIFTDVEVHRITDDTDRGIVAMVNVVVAGAVKLTGIRVQHRRGEAARVVLPSRETAARGQVDFFWPVNGHKTAFDDAILEAYAKTT